MRLYSSLLPPPCSQPASPLTLTQHKSQSMETSRLVPYLLS